MRKGFTLVEVMIVVLIIGILLSIAVPNFIRARELSRYRECIGTLRQLDNAKEMLAQETGLNNGDPCVMADLWPTYIRRSTPPQCMAGGTFNVRPIGTPPECSYLNAPYPHILP